jgi:hypothetical protein
VICHLFYSLSPSATLAGTNGKAFGHNKMHPNPHDSTALMPINTQIQINPAGIISGSSGVKINQIESNGQPAAGCDKKELFAHPGHDVFVEITSMTGNRTGIIVENKSQIHTSGHSIILAAGDAFSEAFADIDSLAASVAVECPSGKARGHQWQGVDFNPGGGPIKDGQDGIGEKGWGTCNKGNGVGNIWVGNQGKGVGGGMAGGCKCDHKPKPDPEPNPEEPKPDKEAPVAPLAQFEIPRIEGCPGLTQVVAMELGITGESLQVAIGNALALNPTIQPCEACASLINLAAILRDEDGSRMAAMIQVFNAIAPADVPFTPEMAASIAAAFKDAEEGSQYSSAMEYIDAFVRYVSILDTKLGSPAGDSVAFVMDKYGTGITGSDNANIGAFLTMHLQDL